MGLELKNYQKRVLRELDAYIALLASTQNLNTAYNRHWHQLGIAVGFGGLPRIMTCCRACRTCASRCPPAAERRVGVRVHPAYLCRHGP